MVNEKVFIVAFYLQWVIIFALSFGVITLFKKHLTSKLAMKHLGLEINAPFPLERIESISGDTHLITAQSSKITILIVGSYGCEACTRIYPVLNKLSSKFQHIQFILTVMGEPDEIVNVQKKYDLRIPVAQLTMDMMQSIDVRIFPFAYSISPEGKVLLKGGINTENDILLFLENDDLPIFKNGAQVSF